MRILYLDIDTLRADHLGCYGYPRNTTPNIDAVAREGVRFDQCFVSDAPCLPSRSACWTGRFGIHTGVVNHGGLAADPFPEGITRGFHNSAERDSFVTVLKKNGMYTASVSPFAERHNSWWFYAGFLEMHNTGDFGHENADVIFPKALQWIQTNGQKDNWFLHINCWDPHNPYDHTEDIGQPFAQDPPPSWMNEDILKNQYQSYGPNSAQDLWGFSNQKWEGALDELPAEIKTMSDFKKWIDGYDTEIYYADIYVGRVVDLLKKMGIYDETIIVITSDHGENQGELNIYGDHHTADYITSRVPFIIKWPGVTSPRVDEGLHYQTDIVATILDVLGLQVPKLWDGKSFASYFKKNRSYSRDYVVVSQCAWSCQRSVVFDHWILIKTYDTGLKDFTELMLFDVAKDPHETNNLAKAKHLVVRKGLKLLSQWHRDMMKTSANKIDPMDIVLKEGGPFHTRDKAELTQYLQRLEKTGRAYHARTLRKFKGKPTRKY